MKDFTFLRQLFLLAIYARMYYQDFCDWCFRKDKR